MAEVGIFVGTMYGNSLLVAEEAQAILSGLGHQAKVFDYSIYSFNIDRIYNVLFRITSYIEKNRIIYEKFMKNFLPIQFV